MQPGYAFPVVRGVVRPGYAPGCFPGLCAEGSVWQVQGDKIGFCLCFVVARLHKSNLRYSQGYIAFLLSHYVQLNYWALV